MNMKLRIQYLIIACALSFASPVLAEQSQQQTSPKNLMQTTIDKLLTVVRAHPGDDQKIIRHKEMREIIEPRFDFSEMAKSSLSTHWNDITPAEQTEFVDLFSELLATTYLNRIDNIDDSEIRIASERIHQSRAIVKTEVTFKGEEFPIDYRMVDTQKGWRVYDVIIENVGLVANYRNEFSGIIRREEFSGLLGRLRDKIATKPS